MKTVLERFLEYVRFDTQSDGDSGKHPSTEKQLLLAEYLVEELKSIGAENVRLSDKGYVYAHLSATPGMENVPAVGFIAHMDTSDAASGKDVKPQIIENWDGSPIPLGNSGILLSPEAKLKGHTIITTDGTTLLGGDDKAGITAIMTAAEDLISSGTPHGKICIGFTPDEEIGEGADFFDVPGFGAKYAYTVDAGEESLIECENFNASSAVVHFKGVSVHPGYAKGKMVNAQKLAMAFDAFLPQDEVPEKTSDREGFYHLVCSSGNVSNAEMHYVLRDHDAQKNEQRKEKMRAAAEMLKKQYGPECVEIVFKDQYRNMIEVMKSYPFLVEIAEKAIRSEGVEPVQEPIRGGTDGAQLCFKGLPCPNIGYGGNNAHGEREYVDLQGMERAARIVKAVAISFAEIER